MVTWPKGFKPNDSTKKLSQMVLSQVIGNRGNGDREAIVVGAGLCEGERAYTVYDPILGEEKYLIYFKRFAGAKTGYGTICRKTICRNPICRT